MDSARINSSSADYGIFPYYASGTPADVLYGAEPLSPDSATENIRPTSAMRQGDSVFISEGARRLYAATSSAAGGGLAVFNMPLENISLYNRIRQERESLEPGDPRIVELSNKLRAILAAGEETISQEELDFVRHDKAWPGGQYRESGAKRGPGQDIADVLATAEHPGKADDSARMASPFAYSSPEATTDAPLYKSRISSSSSPRLYDYAPGNSAGPERLHRVA